MISVLNSCFDHLSLSKMLVEKIVSVLYMDNSDRTLCPPPGSELKK